MKMQEINALRAMLPLGCTLYASLYAYCKDKYSLQLLRYAIPKLVAVSALRQHAAAQLLQRFCSRSVEILPGFLKNERCVKVCLHKSPSVKLLEFAL